MKKANLIKAAQRCSRLNGASLVKTRKNQNSADTEPYLCDKLHFSHFIIGYPGADYDMARLTGDVKQVPRVD